MAPRCFARPAELAPLVGEDVAVSQWLKITQSRINLFAEATDDFQWLHTEPERAGAESPYGRTIAHGLLTQSLIAPLWASAMTIGGVRMKVNYGFNRVRFTSPVLCDEEIRARFALHKYDDLKPGAQLTWKAFIERRDEEKPVCAAEWIMRCVV